MRRFSFFPGCIIPSKLPFIELSARKVLGALGVELVPIEEAGCCPNQMAIRSSDEAMWRILAARNLALAESTGAPVLTLCNGCFDTLRTVNAEMRANEKVRAEVNSALCKGCGTCVATCPAGAIEALHFTDEQIVAQIEGVLAWV